jgi:hypothetical protein
MLELVLISGYLLLDFLFSSLSRASKYACERTPGGVLELPGLSAPALRRTWVSRRMRCFRFFALYPFFLAVRLFALLLRSLHQRAWLDGWRVCFFSHRCIGWEWAGWRLLCYRMGWLGWIVSSKTYMERRARYHARLFARGASLFSLGWVHLSPGPLAGGTYVGE